MSRCEGHQSQEVFPLYKANPQLREPLSSICFQNIKVFHANILLTGRSGRFNL